MEMAELQYGAQIIFGTGNYELGAWKQATETCYAGLDPHYVFLQDSCVQNAPLEDEVLNTDFLAYDILPRFGGPDETTKERLEEVIDALPDVTISDDWWMIAGSMMIIKGHVWEKIVNTGLFDVFLPQNKKDSQATERILGVLFESIGYHPRNHVLPGANWQPGLSKGKYFTKYWKNRE